MPRGFAAGAQGPEARSKPRDGRAGRSRAAGSQGRIGMGRKARAAERAVRNRRNPDWAKRPKLARDRLICPGNSVVGGLMLLGRTGEGQGVARLSESSSTALGPTRESRATGKQHAERRPSMGNDIAVVETRDLTKKYGKFVGAGTGIRRSRSIVDRFSASSAPTARERPPTIKILVGLARPTSGTAASRRRRLRATRAARSSGWSATCPTRSARTTTCAVREYLDFFGAAFGICPAAARQAHRGGDGDDRLDHVQGPRTSRA